MQKKTCQKCFLSIDHLSDCNLILKLYALDIFLFEVSLLRRTKWKSKGKMGKDKEYEYNFLTIYRY
jgi:hypothetical protein